MRSLVIALGALAAFPAIAQPLSPPAETSASIAGKTIDIKYSAPSVRGRQIFGDKGILKNDATYPVWRAGANEATRLHTDGTLTIGTLTLAPGDYSLWVQLDAPTGWNLIVNKQVGQWGTDHDAKQDIGRMRMTMAKTPEHVEDFTINVRSTGAGRGAIDMAWGDSVATAPFTVRP